VKRRVAGTVAPMSRCVPFTGGEKESMKAALDRHRDVVLWKIASLDDEQLRRPVTPTGTHLLGLVKHPASVEYGRFCHPYGRTTAPLPFSEHDPESNMRADPGPMPFRLR